MCDLLWKKSYSRCCVNLAVCSRHWRLQEGEFPKKKVTSGLAFWDINRLTENPKIRESMPGEGRGGLFLCLEGAEGPCEDGSIQEAPLGKPSRKEASANSPERHRE